MSATWDLRLPRTAPRVSGRVHARTIIACTVMAGVLLVLAVIALCAGEVVYTPAEVARTLAGSGTRLQELFVLEYRLPRVVGALVFGAMLGVSGALFQTVTRNPLGSPDIIGFTAGASAGGVCATLFLGSTYAVVAGGAVLGGLVVAALVLVLARGGGTAGFRLVIVGIALTAMLSSLETYMLLVADSDLAQIAVVWGTGSLNGLSFSYSGPAMVLGLILLGVTGFLAGPLGLLDLGDDMSAALGSRPDRTRLLAVLAGVLLVALVVSATGPIAFVALAAPQIGRRLAGIPGNGPAPAGLAGAVVLLSADLVAQYAIPGHEYPVGVVTVAVGGLYLLFLIVHENRKGTL